MSAKKGSETNTILFSDLVSKVAVLEQGPLWKIGSAS